MLTYTSMDWNYKQADQFHTVFSYQIQNDSRQKKTVWKQLPEDNFIRSCLFFM